MDSQVCGCEAWSMFTLTRGHDGGASERADPAPAVCRRCSDLCSAATLHNTEIASKYVQFMLCGWQYSPCILDINIAAAGPILNFMPSYSSYLPPGNISLVLSNISLRYSYTVNVTA